MVLEATMIVVDNSEQSRNGDYLPTRFEAQCDAVNLIFSAKTQSNPESSVGLMSMGSTQPEVLTTLTVDFGKVLDGLHRTRISGHSHLSTALNVASLALKHRQNKSQHQRIIVFTCSPLAEDEKTCIKLAKRLKKNTIAVDIIAFGDLDDATTKKLNAFHENIKGAGGDDSSNIVVIPPGPNLLSDSIVASPILEGDGIGAGGAGGAGAGAEGGEGGGAATDSYPFGVDPNADPELALALRMSMEEEERRQRQQQQEEPGEKLETVQEEGSTSAGTSEAKKDDKKDDEDRMDTA